MVKIFIKDIQLVSYSDFEENAEALYSLLVGEARVRDTSTYSLDYKTLSKLYTKANSIRNDLFGASLALAENRDHCYTTWQAAQAQLKMWQEACAMILFLEDCVTDAAITRGESPDTYMVVSVTQE